MTKRGGKKSAGPAKIQDLAPSNPEQVTGGSQSDPAQMFQQIMQQLTNPAPERPTTPTLSPAEAARGRVGRT